MRRRDFLGVLGGAAAAWPVVTRAQLAIVPRIGFLHSGTLSQVETLVAAFRKGLKDVGFVEGHNVAIEYRWADGDYERLPSRVADLLSGNVKVIAAFGNVAARAAKAATSTIPIVFITGDDPVAVGLVPSLNRPGGNVTGVSMNAGELPTKRLQLLHEIIPEAKMVAMLINPNNANSIPDTVAVKEAAKTLGMQVPPILRASSEQEFDAAFTSLVQNRVQGLLINTDAVFSADASKLAALALRHGMPSIYHSREYVEAGGLAGYGSNRADSYHQLGIYTGRILKGEKPAELPVQQAIKFELALNLRTARALGITVPSTLLARADEVIE